MDASSLLDAWGREILRERGFSIGDADPVSFYLTTETDGCCEVCYSEVPVIEISSGSARASVSSLW